VEVIKNSIKPSKTKKNPPPEENRTRTTQTQRSDAVSMYRNQIARVWSPSGEEIFLVFEGFFKFLITLSNSSIFYKHFDLFPSNFSMIYENFLKKILFIKAGPFYIRKIRNTEGTEAWVRIIKLFDLSSFYLSRVDCIPKRNREFGGQRGRKRISLSPDQPNSPTISAISPWMDFSTAVGEKL